MGNLQTRTRGSYPTARVQHWDHPETLRAAENAFEAYVQKSAALPHYVSVTDRKGPIRRMDEGQDTSRLPAAKSQLVWNTVRGRWYRKDGVLLVLEGELWRVILFYLGKGNTYTSASLYDEMIREVEGVGRRDVMQVWQIWQTTGLSRTDFTQSVQWELSGQNEPPSLPLSSTRGSLRPLDSSSPSLKSWREIMGEPTRDHVGFRAEFHPDHPRLLKIGTREIDGTAVWITFLKGEKKYSRCFNTHLQLTSVHKLGMEWLPELQLDLFDGGCKRDKEACRRDYLSALIEEHLSREPGSVNNASTVLDLIPGLRHSWGKDANEGLSDTDDASTPLATANQQSTRRTRSMISGSGDQTTETVLSRLRAEPASKRTVQEPNGEQTDSSELRSSKRHRQQSPEHRRTAQTVLRISISNNPVRAPVHVLLADCGDVDALFHKVLVEGGIEGSPSTNVRELSATLACSGRGHLIRRGNANDWDFFYRNLQRAWTREADLFVDADCEVDIIIHADI